MRTVVNIGHSISSPLEFSGHFVIVERWPEQRRSIKVAGEIVGVLYPNQIEHLKRAGRW